jgi:hypothetical protein
LRSYNFVVNAETKKMSSIEEKIKNFGDKIDKLDKDTQDAINNLEIKLIS